MPQNKLKTQEFPPPHAPPWAGHLAVSPSCSTLGLLQQLHLCHGELLQAGVRCTGIRAQSVSLQEHHQAADSVARLGR